jgi:hypothetical protein
MRSDYLIGLPVGFLFLAFAYVFLGLFLILNNNEALSSSFLWLRLVLQTYGFAFIAFSYRFSLETERTARFFLAVISLVSLVSVLSVFGVLVIAPPFLELPDARIVGDYFRAANLCLLGYTVYKIVKQLESSSAAIRGLVWGPFAFGVLWLGQYSLLIWGIDNSQTAFVFAHIVRLVALIVLIRIYYVSGRTYEGREAQQIPHSL